MGKKILKSAVWLSLFTVIAKGIGFLRMMVVAFLFGANQQTDAFYLANGMVSNVLYALSTAIAVSFLPIYIEKRVEKGKEELSRYASNTITVLSVLALIVSAVVFLGAPALAKISAPAYGEEQLQQVALYFRILSLGILFSLTTSLLKSLLDAEEIYGYGAVSGIVYSIVTIVFAVVFYRSWGILSLVVSVPAAYLIQYVFLNWRAGKCVRLRFEFDLKDDALRILVKSCIPVLLSNTTVEILQLVDRMLASFSAEGAVSALSYSANLNDLVISVVSSSLITVFFTEFSNNSAENHTELLKSNLRKGVSMLVFLLLPITVITAVFSRDIVTIVYYRGSFGSEAVNLTSLALLIYAMSWMTASVEKLFMKAFYALNDTRTPMGISIFTVIINIILSICFVQFFGFAGIPMGTVAAEMCSVVFNLFFLKRKIGNLGFIHSVFDFAKMVLAALATGTVLYAGKGLLSGHTAFVRFVLAGAAGIVIYFLSLYMLKCRELIWIKEMFSGGKND